MTHKKTIAILLTVMLALSLAAPAFAAGETLSYVAIGDSTANGFGLDGYSGANCGKNVVVPATYIFRFEKYLKGKGYDATLTNLALTGMRTIELDYFLDETVTYDEVDAFAQMRWDEYEEAYETMGALRTAYKEAIIGADIISYELGANNFSNYMLARVGEIFGVDIGFRWGYQEDSFNELMLHSGYDIRIPVKNDLDELLRVATNGAVPDDVLYKLEDALLYGYASFCISFSNSIAKIYELNEDVDLYVFGLVNNLDGVKLSLDSAIIDLGVINGGFIDFINTYITNVDKNSKNYSYVSVKDGVETLTESIGKGGVEHLTADLRYACLELMYSDNMLGKEEAGLFMYELAYGNRDSSVKLEQAQAAWRKETPDELSAAVNGVLAQFVKAAANTAPVDVSGAISLLTDGEGKVQAFESALTNFDGADDFAKGATHLMLMLLKNGTGIHPSPYGHEQKFNYLVKAYEGNVKANMYHVTNIINSVFDRVLEIIRSSNPFRTLIEVVKSIIASIKLPIEIS